MISFQLPSSKPLYHSIKSWLAFFWDSLLLDYNHPQYCTYMKGFEQIPKLIINPAKGIINILHHNLLVNIPIICDHSLIDISIFSQPNVPPIPPVPPSPGPCLRSHRQQPWQLAVRDLYAWRCRSKHGKTMRKS